MFNNQECILNDYFYPAFGASNLSIFCLSFQYTKDGKVSIGKTIEDTVTGTVNKALGDTLGLAKKLPKLSEKIKKGKL